MNRLFVDTSAWFAYFNALDRDHARVAAVLEEWGARLLTTDYVFDELVTLCRYRAGHEAACRAGAVLRTQGVAEMVSVTSGDVESAWTRFRRDADQQHSFTDCTSLAVMERLRITVAAAVDADFRRAGYRTLPA